MTDANRVINPQHFGNDPANLDLNPTEILAQVESAQVESSLFVLLPFCAIQRKCQKCSLYG